MTNANELARSVKDYVIQYRRAVHQHPELSMKEFKTTDRICEELDKMGVSYKRMEPTGVLAEIKGGKGAGKTVLLRGDIDALPIQEDTIFQLIGGLKAVQDFNIKIYKKELVGLIGPNGAGKTTVFNMLTGVYEPTEGTVILNGVPLNGRKTYQFVEAGIARTFQNIRLFKEMTVLDNVKAAFTKDIKYNLFDATFRTKKYWEAEEAAIDKARKLLEIVGLSDKENYLAANLPYGAQRKLEIARALGTDMKLLLLDEPAAGMNPTETSELMECINTIRDKFGIAILLIEHDMSLVMNVCERIKVIDYGQTIAEGLPDEIANNPDVIKAYLGT